MNLRNDKWLVISIYRPPTEPYKGFSGSTYLVEDFSDKRDIFLVMGNFNFQTGNEVLRNVMENNGPSNLIKGNACYKGHESCIDLVLTNRTYLLKNSCSFETGLGDPRHLIYTRLKTTFIITQSKLVNSKKYKKF